MIDKNEIKIKIFYTYIKLTSYSANLDCWRVASVYHFDKVLTLCEKFFWKYSSVQGLVLTIFLALVLVPLICAKNFSPSTCLLTLISFLCSIIPKALVKLFICLLSCTYVELYDSSSNQWL